MRSSREGPAGGQSRSTPSTPPATVSLAKKPRSTNRLPTEWRSTPSARKPWPGSPLLAICFGTGCERPTVATTAQADSKTASPTTRVEVVRPERKAIRRLVEEPGQVEAFEVTAIHARVAGFVRSWSVNIGSKITKGQVMAELDVPELEAEAGQKRAMIEQAEALKAQAEAAVEVARANIDAADAKLAEARAGSAGSRPSWRDGRPSMPASNNSFASGRNRNPG